MRGFVMLALVLVLLAGCAAESDETNVSQPSDTDSTANSIERIVTIGPSNTEIVVALGLGEKIVAADAFSFDVEGLPAHVPTNLDMLALDAEHLLSLMPDIVFITGIAMAGGTDDPLAPVSAAGINVVYVPSSDSVAAVIADILSIADALGVRESGEVLVANMQSEIEAVREISMTMSLLRTVYFELDPDWLVTLGSGTFVNELINIAGGVNIFADHEGWLSTSAEVILQLNPDVILTSADYTPDPVGEILARPGFGVVTAVQDQNVHLITANYVSRPSHNITKALWEIARAIYPEYFPG